jgi:hypothetical protein
MLIDLGKVTAETKGPHNQGYDGGGPGFKNP